MLTFLRQHRPFEVFGTLALSGVFAAIGLMWPVFVEFLQTGLVPRFPTVILATGMVLCAAILAVLGVILDHQARYFSEMKRLHYLQTPGPGVFTPPAPA
jgi:glycerol-3-phosphate acyltransferase PlsY